MLFTLSVGLHNIPLTSEDKVKASPPYQVRFLMHVWGRWTAGRESLLDSSDWSDFYSASAHICHIQTIAHTNQLTVYLTPNNIFRNCPLFLSCSRTLCASMQRESPRSSPRLQRTSCLCRTTSMTRCIQCIAANSPHTPSRIHMPFNRIQLVSTALYYCEFISSS